MEKAKDILRSGSPAQVRALFAFDSSTSPERVALKFRLWSRYFFPKFFPSKDAPFHLDMDLRRARLYQGHQSAFLNIAFRGSAKTTRAKLFRAFVIACDRDHQRRYMRILSKDLGNAKQSVTDVYNMLNHRRVQALYPEVFERTDSAKREETMASFTTATGVKMIATTIGTDQRGALQEEARPDFDWYDDFETRLSLTSAVTTVKIWENMEEARTGLAKNGGSEYTCNYISERGNVHRLVERIENKLIVPIEQDGKPTWDRYTMGDIEVIKRQADDYAGEYLCQPSAGADIFFDRTKVDEQKRKSPIRDIAGFKIFHEYDPSHRYGSGHDVAGGVGLDHSTSVYIDFSTNPSRVVATFKSNTIKPDSFGDEIQHQADRFGRPLIAVENNKFDMCIGRLKQLDVELYTREGRATKIGLYKATDYGWNTNADTKPKMLFALKKAVEDGHLELSDPDLIAECRSYSRDDLMDREEDVRLTTRHFDLLMAAAIAYQMKDHAEPAPRGLSQEVINTRHERSRAREDVGL